MNADRRRGARILGVAHLGQAAILLTQPPGVLRRVVGAREDIPPPWIVRALGGRTLIQGMAEYLSARRNVLAAGVAVDLAHAASMLAAARMWPSHRRAALASAGIATASAIVGALVIGARR